MSSPLSEIRAALERMVEDYEQEVGHVCNCHEGWTCARCLGCLALSLLGEMERGAKRMWWCGYLRNAYENPGKDGCECARNLDNDYGCGWRLLLPLPPENGGKK